MINYIPDDKLQLVDVPTIEADWVDISRFAQTYNGYIVWGSFEICALIANEQRHDTLAELRTCLFFEERRWAHYGDEPDTEAMAYLCCVLEKIREHLATKQSPNET